VTRFFPQPYPDETFYSVCARCLSYIGCIYYKSHELGIFNGRSVFVPHYFAHNLNHLSGIFQMNHIDSDDIIDNHTLFPVLEKFLSREDSNILRAGSHGADRRNKYSLERYITINNPILYDLRFCYQCIDKDISIYGEAYWHRVHQVPWVAVCPYHDSILMSIKLQYIRFKISSLDDILKMKNISFEEISIRYSHEKDFSVDAKFLLSNTNKFEFVDIARCIKIFLSKRGYVYETGAIKTDLLIRDLFDYYSEDLLTKIYFPVSYTQISSRLLHGSTSRMRPIYYIAVARFLGISIEEVFIKACDTTFCVMNPSYGKLFAEELPIARYELTDAQFALIESLLCTAPRRGRPVENHRQVLNGIFWKLNTGLAWSYIPERYGLWTTIYQQYRAWRRDNTWKRVMATLQIQFDANEILVWP
jgi:transposase